MDLARLLRLFVLLDIVFIGSSVALYFFHESLLPEQLSAYVASQREAPITVEELVAAAFAVPLLIAKFVAWIGLWRFWKYARVVYLIVCVGSLVLVPLLGPTVQPAWTAALDEASSIISGLILGLIYFSELRVRYGRRELEEIDEHLAI